MHKPDSKPWLQLHQLLEDESYDQLEGFLQELEPAELIRTIFRLEDSEQQLLLKKISTDRAVEIIEDLPDERAADLLDELPAEEAMNIVTALASDDKVDVLTEMTEATAAAVLEAMDDESAANTRLLMQYDADVAGGLMKTEFISFSGDSTVRQVLEDLSARQEEYAQYKVPYLYVLTPGRVLEGILRVRDLVFADPESELVSIVNQAKMVSPTAGLHDLAEFFEENEINSVPVVEPHTKAMIGIVTRRAVAESLTLRSESERLRQAGIVGGEEFRAMPVATRSRRRLSWLSINIVLNMIAASVIAMYQDTLSAVIALAVFLPIVSDMSGCSGNQAVAVSLRELSLGIIVPKDLMRVWRQEVAVGIINGIALGVLIAIVAFWWQGNPWLGLVVGGALTLNTIIAVSIGGTVPLLLRAVKVDPAVAAGPILTTVTDMCGFALVLGLATLALPLLT